jgi:hypothetical protein
LDFRPEINAIDDLAQDGLVVRDGLILTIPDASRTLVRNVCAVFDRYLENGAPRHSALCSAPAGRLFDLHQCPFPALLYTNLLTAKLTASPIFSKGRSLWLKW